MEVFIPIGPKDFMFLVVSKGGCITRNLGKSGVGNDCTYMVRASCRWICPGGFGTGNLWMANLKSNP